MDRPFGEIHQLYRLVYLRAEAQAKARQEEEKAKADAEQGKNKSSNKPINQNNQTISAPMMDQDDVEEAFEELMGGGI